MTIIVMITITRTTAATLKTATKILKIATKITRMIDKTKTVKSITAYFSNYLKVIEGSKT
jgi:hypothetical protein